jgi:hypothetical protein
MRHQRQEARRRSAEAHEARECELVAAAQQASANEVIPWLRGLGVTAAEARRAVAACAHKPEAPLEVRVRAALATLSPRGTHRIPCAADKPA